MRYGIFLSSEEFPPRTLVEQAVMAEDAGFERVWISDHYHPWIDRQGHSPFVWSVIGAIAQATDLGVDTGVTCPTIRTHPAIIAQAAATSGCLLEGRFRLGVGSGENLNEHILGDRWPEAHVRLEMLEEAVEVMRLLWQGGQQSHRGRHYTVENARVYDLPDEPVPILMSGFGPKSAELAGRIGDGFAHTSPARDLVQTFKEAGGDGPCAAGMKVCWGTDADEAVRTIHEIWPNTGLPGELAAQELPTPAHFDQACELVTEDAVSDTPHGPDPQAYIDSLREYADAGFDEVYFHQVGGDLAGFLKFFRDEVEPALT
jgi:G6PDH family F420-dependent oxidoreductase